MAKKAKTKGVEGGNMFNTSFNLVFVNLKNISQFMNSDYGTIMNSSMDVFYYFHMNELVD
jgi:hypothetical protein